MKISLEDGERAALEEALGKTGRVREWRRYRAVLLADEGQSARAIAQALCVSEASVTNWVAAWRRDGQGGLQEGVHPGRAPKLDAAGVAWLDTLLTTDPQERGYALTGWTVPALLAETQAAGYRIGAHTLRRIIWRLGWRWKRPKFVLGRPDPAYAEKKSS